MKRLIIIIILSVITGCSTQTLDIGCEFNEKNLQAYFDRLHELMHHSTYDEEMVQRINDDECVYNATYDQKSLKITAIWETTNDTVIFDHGH